MNEKIFVEINGIKQGMFLQSENEQGPVLLFLHGGAGSPEIAFNDKHPSGLEKLFTVCWWEQRGAGITFSSKTTKQEMTMQQMIDDTIEVTKYLLKRFNKEKIYIMGHSWGTLLGMLTISRAPSLYCAYMGIGQLADQDKSERLAYSYMLEEFKKAGNTKMVKKLEKYPIDKGGKITMQYLGLRSEGMNNLGIGVMRSMTSMMECVKLVLSFKNYTLSEKLKFARGGSFSLSCFWDNVVGVKLIDTVSEVTIPVYIFHGKHDYQVSYALSKEYFTQIKAPLKGFYTFENSAHSPCFEEAPKMLSIIENDVFNGKTDLADNI